MRDSFELVKNLPSQKIRRAVDTLETRRLAKAVSSLLRPVFHGVGQLRTSELGIEIWTPTLPFWAVVTAQANDNNGTPCYSWTELWDDGAGNFTVLDKRRSGSATALTNQAYEVRKSATVPVDGTAYVIMWRSYDALHYNFWWPGSAATTFNSPVTFNSSVTFAGASLVFNSLNQSWSFSQPATISGSALTLNNTSVTYNAPVAVYGGLDAQGGLLVTPLKAPKIDTVTNNGITGSTPYDYGITGVTAAGLETSITQTLTTTTANATLTSGNNNAITFTQPAGNQFTTYNIIRTKAPVGVTTGTILSIPADATVSTLTGLDIGQKATATASTTGPVSNQTAIVATPALIATGITVPKIPTPPPPTLTIVGFSGSKTVSVQITLVLPNGLESSHSTTATTSTAPNTVNSSQGVQVSVDLSASGIPQWLIPLLQVKVYTVPTTDATYGSTGPLGNLTASAAGVYPALLLNGQGPVPGPSTPPTTSTLGVASIPTLTGINVVPLATPAAPAVQVVGTTGATTITYKVVAYDGWGNTAASAATTVTNANATLSGSNYPQVSWQPVPGALSYGVWRTAAGGTPSTTGLIGTVYAGQPLTLADTGLAGDTTAAPTADTTGQILQNGVPISGSGSPTLSWKGPYTINFGDFAKAAHTSDVKDLGYTLPLGGMFLGSKWYLPTLFDDGSGTLAVSLTVADNPANDGTMGTAFFTENLGPAGAGAHAVGSVVVNFPSGPIYTDDQTRTDIVHYQVSSSVNLDTLTVGQIKVWLLVGVAT